MMYIDIDNICKHLEYLLQLGNVTATVGEDLELEISFCARPPASASWVVRVDEDTGGHQLMLLSGRKHGRFSTQTRW